MGEVKEICDAIYEYSYIKMDNVNNDELNMMIIMINMMILII